MLERLEALRSDLNKDSLLLYMSWTSGVSAGLWGPCDLGITVWCIYDSFTRTVLKRQDIEEKKKQKTRLHPAFTEDPSLSPSYDHAHNIIFPAPGALGTLRALHSHAHTTQTYPTIHN